LANMYRERKTWSSRKFGESKFFFGEDGVFQMKEFRTTLIYILVWDIYSRYTSTVLVDSTAKVKQM